MYEHVMHSYHHVLFLSLVISFVVLKDPTGVGGDHQAAHPAGGGDPGDDLEAAGLLLLLLISLSRPGNLGHHDPAVSTLPGQAAH